MIDIGSMHLEYNCVLNINVLSTIPLIEEEEEVLSEIEKKKGKCDLPMCLNSIENKVDM